MSFGSGLSGVAAANKDLKITGNNIANASTTGFKASRAEFGDAYTTSILGMGQDPIGSGVNVTNVGQKFEQGNISQITPSLILALVFSVSIKTAISSAIKVQHCKVLVLTKTE